MEHGEKRHVCSTNVEPVKLQQEWSIGNFASLMKLCKPGQCLRSQPFVHSVYEDVQWQLCLYPGGKREDNKGYVSLFLKMYAPPMKDISLTAEYKLFFLSETNEKKFCNINIGEFHSKTGKKGFGWGLRNLPRQKVMQSIRTDGSLLILCEVEVLPELTKVPCRILTPRKEDSTKRTTVPAQFVTSMQTLLDSGRMSDFTVIVGSRSFRVHKCMLAAHSAVFAAMFDSDLVEAQNSQVELTDFSAASVGEMLQYLYTGQNPNMKDYAMDLIGLAEKYGLLELKAACETELSHRITKDSVCQLVALADLYSANILKETCIAFIAANKKEVTSSEEYVQLKAGNNHLVTDILENLLGVGVSANTSFADGPPPAKRLKKF